MRTESSDIPSNTLRFVLKKNPNWNFFLSCQNNFTGNKLSHRFFPKGKLFSEGLT